MRKLFGMLAGALMALALVAVVPSARADDFNQASQFTFSRPVALPGHLVLPAGTYWFIVPDSINTPNLVQVFNANRTDLITQFLTISADRMNTSDRSQLTFAEQSGKRPIAMMDWYYPDRQIGHEFVYSNRMEARLNEDPQVTIRAKSAPQLNG